MLTSSQIDDIKARISIGDVARDLGAVLRQSAGRLVGSCPMCGGGKRATRFEIKKDVWVCAVCSDGGDVIRLLRQATGCSFADAVERLGGARLIDDTEQRRLDAQRAQREAAREREAARYRQRELDACTHFWAGGDASRTICAAYLAARGCMMPSSAMLRDRHDVPFFHGEYEDEAGRKSPRIIHRGPAMLSPFVSNDGVMVGMHITWLAPDCGGKAMIVDPDTGEVVSPKKMRGTKAAAHLVLRQPPRIERLFLAEGIETVLSVATALQRTRRLRMGDGFWVAGDLGNLGGPHLETIEHPTEKTPKGRAKRIPGPVPDMAAAGIRIPASVTHLLLLGDGDSEPFLTATTLERGRRRYAAERMDLRKDDPTIPELTIGVAMAPAGSDFNDMLRGR